MLQRILGLSSGASVTRRNAAKRLYDVIVARAREIVFYRDWGVPDTVDGRFDNILCHVALTIGRLQSAEPGGIQLAQTLFDVMFKDMDLNLREIGVGDLAVRKHFQRMSKAFNGRVRNYTDVFQSGDTERLKELLVRNLYRKAEPTAHDLARMSAYLQREWQGMPAIKDDQILSGNLEFSPV